MRILALKCGQCAAPLDLPADSTTRQCDYCGSTNLVKADSAAGPDSEPGPEKVTQLSQADQQLHDLDVEWEAYRRKYLKRREDGTYDIPDPTDWRYQKIGVLAVAGILLLIAVFTQFSYMHYGERPAVAFVFLLAPIPVGASILLLKLRARHKVGVVYRRSVENYRHERRQILASIQSD